jgi:hypothetical protein
VPWELLPKTIEQRLFDAMVDVPGIQEEFDMLETITHPHEVFQNRVRLIQRAWAVDSALEKWSELVRQESSPLQYWPEFSLVDNPADDPQLGKVFPIADRFANIRTAQMYLYYWASKILLYRTLRLTYKALREQVNDCTAGKGPPAAGSEDTSCDCCSLAEKEVSSEDNYCGKPSCAMAFLPRCPDASTLWENACNIAQSMEYCMSDEMRLLGSQLVVCLSLLSASTSDKCNFYKVLANPLP